MMLLDAKTGIPINQTAKTGKSAEIEGKGVFCGHRFLLKTKLYGDKRCLYCGRWFHWKDTDYFTWVRQGNIDHMNNDNNLEPLHCGSDHCSDYHKMCLDSEKNHHEYTMGEMEHRTMSLFKYLKRRKAI